MSDVVIQIENVSKLYRLGTIGTGSFRQDLKRWFQTSVLKKENSFFQSSIDDAGLSQNFIWALNDVSLEVKEGEVWGIVGRNGAGKSTLLKILSRVVRPTKGVIRGKGTVNSLLEVGTGFHDELTGRENIYVSGHMLGMKKQEIKNKFDEIVEFSGIEQFIDTPVKRYSSGMYVRLAFAVAAHLEPDILIVDEVLAVGDAEFQKRCMGKMKDVAANKGRTIIFVSHNMQAINSLCNKAVWLQKGKVAVTGDAYSVVNKYMGALQRKLWKQEWKTIDEAPGNEFIKVLSVELVPHLENALEPVDIRTPLTVKFTFYNHTPGINLSTGLHLFMLTGECIFDVTQDAAVYDEGVIEAECHIPGNLLNDGSYYFSVIFVKDTSVPLYYFEECLHFDMEDYRGNIRWYGKWQGAVRPQLPFKMKQCTTALQKSLR